MSELEVPITTGLSEHLKHFLRLYSDLNCVCFYDAQMVYKHLNDIHGTESHCLYIHKTFYKGLIVFKIIVLLIYSKT